MQLFIAASFIHVRRPHEAAFRKECNLKVWGMEQGVGVVVVGGGASKPVIRL